MQFGNSRRDEPGVKKAKSSAHELQSDRFETSKSFLWDFISAGETFCFFGRMIYRQNHFTSFCAKLFC